MSEVAFKLLPIDRGYAPSAEQIDAFKAYWKQIDPRCEGILVTRARFAIEITEPGFAPFEPAGPWGEDRGLLREQHRLEIRRLLGCELEERMSWST